MQPTRVAVPSSPFARAVKAFLSLVLMLGLVGGLPVALLVFAGNPIPGDAPTLDGIRSALTSPDDGTLFLDVLAVVGWLAWALFTLSLLLELMARLFRRKAPSIFGLRSTQRMAGVLVAAVAAIAVSPTVTSAHAAVVQAPAPVTAPVDPSAVDRLRPAHAPASDSVLHLVERGEGLLDLQEKYGVPWQRIAEANYDKQQPDGRALMRGQTRIYPGWQLTIPTSTVRPTVADTANQELQEYEVARGDWLWHISERYLGDPERYPEIAELNPQYEQRNAEFPDHIEPGWTLQLPEGAEDRGPIEHATGTATPEEAPEGGAAEQPPPPEAEQPPPEAEQPAPPEAEPAPPEAEQPAPPEAEQPRQPPARQPEAPAPPEQPQPPVSSGFGEAPEQPVPAPPEATGLGEAPAQPERPRAPAGPEPVPQPAPQPPAEESEDGFSSVQPDLERLAPAALAGAGLLTALVLGAAGAALYRRNQHHRSGFRVTSPTARRLEKVLRAAQQPLDATRLDAALRNLAAGLTGRTAPLPDIAGAMVDEGSVHLLLAAACPDPPPPWQDHGERWTLPAGAPLPPPSGAGRLAPLPMLAAIGSQAGIHLLLDLERLGFLTIYGDPGRALDLLRYLAAELACNSWSDAAEVLLAGFDPRQAELLTTLNPTRVRAVPSIPDAVALLRHRIASARATLGHTGAPDALAGRINGVAADAWMPQILLASAASATDLAALAALEQELDGTARCAVAVATTDATPPPPGHARVTVTPDGVVHVRLPFLRAQLAAASLTTEELAPLAETMRAARTAPQVPVPPAPEPEPWAIGTDAAGAARSVGQATVGASWFQPGADEPPTVPVPAVVPYLEGDPSLDEDLREWHAEQSTRPRIGVLGPVSILATGTEPETRRRLHAELLVFLAQRAGRGADAGQIDAALWPDLTVTDSARQLFISRARRWLGTTPDGAQWLPDVGPDLVYRLADGYLFDWHLFRRLRTRADARGGDEATADLRAALELVRGTPLDGADQPSAPGTRNPYPWLADSDVHPHHLVAAIVDVAHQLAERCLAGGDPAGARWAVQQAWLADTARSFDQPWRDMLRAEHADGHTDRMRAVLAELMEAREAEAPEDLSPETYSLVSCWPPNVLVPSAPST